MNFVVGLYFSAFIIGGRRRAMKRGVPNRLMNRDNRVKKIDLSLLPTVEEALASYPGSIFEPCGFGVDPLEQQPAKRYDSFCYYYSFQSLFAEVGNGIGSLSCTPT